MIYHQTNTDIYKITVWPSISVALVEGKTNSNYTKIINDIGQYTIFNSLICNNVKYDVLYDNDESYSFSIKVDYSEDVDKVRLTLGISYIGFSNNRSLIRNKERYLTFRSEDAKSIYEQFFKE